MLEIRAWPAEDESKLLDPSHRRRPQPLEHFLPAMEERNARLLAAKQPVLILAEVLGGRLYTGCASLCPPRSV